MGDCSETTKLIYNIIYERYQAEWQRKNQIESKATNIVGVVGIIFGLLSNTGVYLLQQRASADHLYIYSLWFFVFSLVIFIITMFLSLIALFVTKWRRIPETKYLIETYVEKGVEINETLEDLYYEYSEGVEKNIKKNNMKAICLSFSFISFGLGILLTAFFVLSLIMKI